MAAVPIGSGCTLQAVVNNITAGGGSPGTSLSTCISAARAAAFNATYYTAPATSLAEFQGYDHTPNASSTFWEQSNGITFTSSTTNECIKCLWEAGGASTGYNYTYYSSQGLNVNTQLYEAVNPWAPLSLSSKFVVGNAAGRLEPFNIYIVTSGIITSIVASTSVTSDCSCLPTTTTTTAVPTTTTTTTAGDVTPPVFTTALSVTGKTTTSLTLGWVSTDNVGVVGQDLFWRISGGSWAIVSLAEGVTSYTKTGLTQNTTYEMYVQAWDAASNSTNSNTVTDTTVSTDGVLLYITMTGGNVATTCNYSNFSAKYHNNYGNTYPEVGHYFYNESGQINGYNGGNQYHTDDTGNSYRITTAGYISAKVVNNCAV